MVFHDYLRKFKKILMLVYILLMLSTFIGELRGLFLILFSYGNPDYLLLLESSDYDLLSLIWKKRHPWGVFSFMERFYPIAYVKNTDYFTRIILHFFKNQTFLTKKNLYHFVHFIKSTLPFQKRFYPFECLISFCVFFLRFEYFGGFMWSFSGTNEFSEILISWIAETGSNHISSEGKCSKIDIWRSSNNRKKFFEFFVKKTKVITDSRCSISGSFKVANIESENIFECSEKFYIFILCRDPDSERFRRKKILKRDC